MSQQFIVGVIGGIVCLGLSYLAVQGARDPGMGTVWSRQDEERWRPLVWLRVGGCMALALLMGLTGLGVLLMALTGASD